MDALERKSWALSLAIHAALVLSSLFSFGVPILALRSAAHPPPPTPATPSRGEVVLAPEVVGSGGMPVLPSLPALAAQPSVITPAATSFAGEIRSRGMSPSLSSPVVLPQASTQPTPLSDALRGQQANPALSREAANRATAADHLDFLVYNAFPRLWRGYATQITNRRLVIEVIADERGVIRRAALFHCTTGVPELDRAIADWLVEQGTSLPRLPAGQALRFAVALP